MGKAWSKGKPPTRSVVTLVEGLLAVTTGCHLTA